MREHRELSPARGRPGRGLGQRADVPHGLGEQAALADLLRRAHLEDGIDWAEMAVLTRTGSQLSSIPRALISGNVPVEVHADQLPLAREPAVATLLLALRCAAEPTALTPDTARTLLTGPLAGLDSGDLRRLGRALRAEEALAGGGATLPRPADQLIREAVAEPSILAAFEPVGRRRRAGPGARAACRGREPGERRRGRGRAVGAVERHRAGPARWPGRLRRAVDRGGTAGRLADRDLDAVIALFALAARAQERTGHAGVTDFISGLQAQDIAADTLADKAERGGAVQLMTAHASKGLQWRARRRGRGAGGAVAGPAASRLAAGRRPDRAARAEPIR